MIERITLWQHRIPLVKPLQLKNVSLDYREGLLLQWHTDYGVFWSETCPLPDFSAESLVAAKNQLITYFDEWFDQFNPMENWEQHQRRVISPLYPSVRFGLEMGLYQLFQSKEPDKGHSISPNLAIAGLITGDIADTSAIMQTPVVKIKVGKSTLDEDIQRICKLVNQLGPNKCIRLDANQSWTLEQVSYFFSAIPTQQIDFIEEPLADVADYAHWTKTTPVPYAIDEQVQNPGFFLSAQPGLSTIVLKPMLLGLNRSIELITQAQRMKLTTIISSAYESSLTLNFLYRLAQRLTSETPPGLDTFRQYTHDLIAPLMLGTGPSNPLIPIDKLQKVADYP